MSLNFIFCLFYNNSYSVSTSNKHLFQVYVKSTSKYSDGIPRCNFSNDQSPSYRELTVFSWYSSLTS